LSSTQSAKKNLVVSSVAIPVGTITPIRPVGDVPSRITSAKIA
jgi:hypothetical protein